VSARAPSGRRDCCNRSSCALRLQVVPVGQLFFLPVKHGGGRRDSAGTSRFFPGASKFATCRRNRHRRRSVGTTEVSFMSIRKVSTRISVGPKGDQSRWPRATHHLPSGKRSHRRRKTVRTIPRSSPTFRNWPPAHQDGIWTDCVCAAVGRVENSTDILTGYALVTAANRLTSRHQARRRLHVT